MASSLLLKVFIIGIASFLKDRADLAAEKSDVSSPSPITATTINVFSPLQLR